MSKISEIFSLSLLQSCVDSNFATEDHYYINCQAYSCLKGWNNICVNVRLACPIFTDVY
jgi:hypothetical protein